VAAGPASSGDGRQPLARLLTHLGITTDPWRALALQYAVCAAAAGAGAALRLAARLPVVGVSGIGAALVVAGLLWPRRPVRPQRPAPPWAAAAAAADAGLPAGVLGSERRRVAGFAGRTGRRGAFVHVATCQPPARYPGLCAAVLVFGQRGYLLVVLGEHVLPVAAAPVAHELAHLTGWRQRLARAARLARLAGWLLAGWAAGWPWLLAAGAAVQVITMLAMWVVEVGCDQQAAREHGPAAVITALTSGQCPTVGMPGWERRLNTSLWYLTALAAHPPVWVRCLIARTLTPATGDGPHRSQPPGCRVQESNAR
jgi:hypothetical protein